MVAVVFCPKYRLEVLENILEIYSEKELFYYIQYFIKWKYMFHICLDCFRVLINK